MRESHERATSSYGSEWRTSRTHELDLARVIVIGHERNKYNAAERLAPVSLKRW